MLEEIAKMYGTKADYLDMNTGNIFKFSGMYYDEDEKVTRVPVFNINHLYIGTASMKGNWCKQNE
jgi:hypothetical protein